MAGFGQDLQPSSVGNIHPTGSKQAGPQETYSVFSFSDYYRNSPTEVRVRNDGVQSRGIKEMEFEIHGKYDSCTSNVGV